MDSLNEHDIATIRYHLEQKKYGWRSQRWHRLQREGRIVHVAGLPPPIMQSEEPPALSKVLEQNLAVAPPSDSQSHYRLTARWLLAKAWLLTEILVVFGLLLVSLNFLRAQANLNRESTRLLQAQSQAVALPTRTPSPVIDVVVLPGGHKPPTPGQLPQPGEAGNIPAHLLPALNAYQPPPIPTPFPEQARRIQIAAIGVDSPIVQGMYDWEQLKKGVAQKIGSASPGQLGNVALAGHNDIYGEIFRHLDKLSPGDEIIISTELKSYTYIIRETQIVVPTETWVLQPTDYAATTLISCYPYRVNTQRIVVFADLAR